MTLIKNQPATATGRRFEFAGDSFAFANELLWEYKSDAVTGKMNFRRREPKPDYALRCFVLVRAARQFLYHARFEPDQKIASETTYGKLIRRIVSRSPRLPCAPSRQIVVPGFANLREFSAARGKILKAECGGAWQSYVLRSHWRMVFPISRTHQVRTAQNLIDALGQNRSPIIHLVTFPSLTINHGMIVFDGTPTDAGFTFYTYDPNDPSAPTQLKFDRHTQTFLLPPNAYWAGGKLNIIEIFQSWLM
jgi:hypothetical protein